jgi:serine/threonine-protein kinase
VVKSDPAEGQQVAAGSQVTLFIAQAAPPITVPPVARSSPAQAAQILAAAGLKVKPPPYQSVPSSDVPAGTVLKTDPDVGARVAPGTAVALILATAPSPQKIAVPPVARSSPAQAIQLLTAAGLTVKPPPYKQVPSSDIPEGAVVQTDPDVGAQVAPGTAVALIIAMKPGVPSVIVPPVAGLAPPDAAKALVEAGLSPKPAPYASEPSAAQEPGRVLRTDPPIGQSVPAKTLVTIVLAAAPNVVVPTVTGMSPAEAAKALSDKGLVADPPPYPSLPSPNLPAGSVIKTDPSAGQSVPSGSHVLLIVAASVKVMLPTFPKPAPLELVIKQLLGMGMDVKLRTSGSGPVQPFLIATDPPEGSLVTQGGIVMVITYGALIQPIDLRGLSPAQIDSIIKNLH